MVLFADDDAAGETTLAVVALSSTCCSSADRLAYLYTRMQTTPAIMEAYMLVMKPMTLLGVP